ncbi:MAG: hypothetical protein OHK0052_21080 [Anaerolineales bacterium]
MNQPPLIIAFIGDLMLVPQIEQAATNLGCALRWVESTAQIADSAPAAARRTLGEPLHGLEGILLNQITRRPPVLLLFDLSNAHIPWQTWLPILKTSPATRRIPIVCYGPHVRADWLQQAQTAGADAVLPRSRFVRTLPQILQQHIQPRDSVALDTACEQPLAERAIHGLQLLAAGAYFEAHEELEIAWQQDPTPARELYRAILQIAVAYLHIQRGNYNGAVKMLLRVRQWVAPLPDECRGVDVAQLRHNAEILYQHLTQFGAQNLHQLDTRLLKPVVWKKQAAG